MASGTMSDNNEPLDLQKIEARLKASNLAGREIRYMSAGEDPLIEIGFGPKPTKLENMTDLQEIFFINAPTDIAALVSEVHKLREDYVKHTENLNRIIDSNHREIWQLQKELAEAKRTQVKDGGRGQLRPFPEPAEEE